jgi:GDP-4-dehydro-6-deoxy-D-mannose reductase
VTGAQGALGEALLARLSLLPDTTVLGTTRRPERVVSGVILCDLQKKSSINEVLSNFNPTCIFHLAASFSQDIDTCLNLNVQVPLEILCCVQRLPEPCRVVLIGSAAEYGLVKPEDNPVMETCPLQPISAYGFSKASQSHLVSLFHSMGVDVVCARIFNLWGARMSERLFIGRIQKQIEEFQSGVRTSIEIGPLDAYRDYISVEETCSLLHKIATLGASGEIYNVATGEPVQMRVLLEKILDEQGISMECVFEERNLSNRPGVDVPMIYADMSKTRQLLSNI